MDNFLNKPYLTLFTPGGGGTLPHQKWLSLNDSSSSQIIQGSLATVSRKKVAVILDFVQMRGGGVPCPNFVSTFHKLNA